MSHKPAENTAYTYGNKHISRGWNLLLRAKHSHSGWKSWERNILTLDVRLEEVPGEELERHVSMMREMEQVEGVNYL
jgi:hypothetical protein